MISRLKALFKRQHIETDMDKEMHFHVEMLAKDYEQAGMSSEDARNAALRKFGNVTQIKERGRDVRGAGLLEEFGQDVAYGIRMLRRSPGFTIVALVALSLGIGVTTAIFSIANGLFFRSTSDGQHGALVRFYGLRDDGNSFDSFSYANYKDVRDQASLFAGLAAHQYVPVSISAGGNESREVLSELVSGNYFPVLGVVPKAGRLFLPDEDITTAPHLVAVLSERFVREEMASDAGVVGRRIYVNGTSFEVIGVVADSFKGTYSAVSTNMWFPLSAMESVRPRGIALTNRGWGWLFGTGRLKPGVTIEQASQEISRIAQQLERDYPRANRGLKFQITEAGTLPDEFRANVSRFLVFFMCAAGAVLLITCANIASLTLARTTARRREVAIRQSLGAARFRLIRQWLTESVLLSLVGGICGAGFAIVFRSAILGFAPPEWMSFAPDVSFDWRVLGFTISLLFMAGILFGLAPAIQAARAEVVSALKSDAGSSIGSRRPRFYGVVVAAQVTISLVLMIISGLLYRSLQQSEAFHTGFDNDRLAVAEFDLRRNGYAPEARQTFYEQLVSNLRTTPGVADITRASVVPLGEDRENSGYQIEGYTPPNGSPTVSIANDAVGADYFKAMGIPIIEGRAFDPNLPPGPPVEAVVNQAMAEKFWPNESAIGKRLGVDGNLTIRVVGVARTIPYYQIGETPRPYVYVSSSAVPAQLTMFVKTTVDPKQVLSAVRQIVRTLDPRMTVDRIRTFAEVRRVPLFPARALLAVASGFGLLSLVLTLIGIYGVISYSVSRRTREFGIRMALGAKRSLVFQMVIAEGLKLTVIGIVAGILAASLCTRFLSALLFGVTAMDPITFGSISVLMVLTAALACYVPARRATRVDPLVALRQDG